MAKTRLGDKPLEKKSELDWIGEGGKEPLHEPQYAESLEILSSKKIPAERLSLTVDPELATEFNKLCDMWRAAYPNTQKKDICNKMLNEFIRLYSAQIRKRLSQVLG